MPRRKRGSSLSRRMGKVFGKTVKGLRDEAMTAGWSTGAGNPKRKRRPASSEAGEGSKHPWNS